MSVTIHEHVLDSTLCAEIYHATLASLKENKEQWTSNAFWDQGIIKASHPVLVKQLPEHYKRLVLNTLVENGILKHLNYHVMQYAWTKLSYIPWHNDDIYSDAMTIYLNTIWNKDWGGYFLYEDSGNQIRGYIPRFNTAVQNKNKIAHATTPVSLDASDVRVTLQIFSGG